MKKSIIAAGATAAVLAAMPVLGVFASNTFTDTLQVTVEDGCTLENSTGTAADNYAKNRSFTTTIAAGSVGYLNADNTGAATSAQGTVTVTCNTNDPSKFVAVTVDVDGFTGQNPSNTFAGGEATSGTTSAWAIKSNASVNTGSFETNGDNWADYAAAADGTFLKATANKAVTFNPSYRVYIGTQQAADTYGATATYSVAIASN